MSIMSAIIYEIVEATCRKILNKYIAQHEDDAALVDVLRRVREELSSEFHGAE